MLALNRRLGASSHSTQNDEFAQALRTLSDEASLHDRAEADVAALVAPLVRAGAFIRALPMPLGDGLATDSRKSGDLHDCLRRIGGANLSAGRIFEGHINALKLVFTFGSAEQQAEISDVVAGGALMGVWNAEAPSKEVGLFGPPGELRLTGSKIYASGVGLLERPLITAKTPMGDVMMIIPKAASQAPFDLSGWRMRGMRATATGTVHLDDIRVDENEIVGLPGDYYRSPGFKGGAWRFSTVQFGAVEEIARLMFDGLRGRGRANDAHHKGRAAQARMAVETARLWTQRSADVVEGGDHPPEEAEAYAGMARLVVERSALEVIGLAEQALGLMAFREAEPIDRIIRDLSTYLRQPFPDAILEEVGQWALRR